MLAACSSSATGTSTLSPTPGPTQLVDPSSPTSASAAPSGSATPTPRPSIPASNNLDGITVAGDFGKLPQVKIPAPWAVTTSQSKVIQPGNGPEIAKTSTVEIHYWGANGRTGEVFDESFSGGKPIALPLEGFIPGFVNGLVGQKSGSRVLIGITGPDGYGPNGGNPQAGIEADDCIVFVVDILAVSLTQPAGTPVTPAAGLPTVTGDVAKPQVTIPAGATPPTSLVVQPLIKGAGREVAPTDVVQVNYAEYAWSNGQLVKQTYGYKPLEGPLAQTLPAWQEGLAKQTVGSRVLIVAPPAKSYPSGNPRIGVKPGETMVYVVDILFASTSG